MEMETEPPGSVPYEFFKKLRIIGFSRKKNVYGVNPLFISIGFIVLTEVLATILRKCIKRLLNDGFVKQLLLEFVATAELCAVCFELIIVADNYGVRMYAIFLFLLTLWWTRVWKTEAACPYVPLEDFWEGREALYRVLLLIVSQVLGGLVIYNYVQQLWQLELVQTHRSRAYKDCTADLQVNMLYGALIECVATCLCRVTYKVLVEADGKYAGLVNAFFGTSMVVAAFNYSGGYFNPALATSLKFNCQGNTFLEHMVVYWVGASLGALASIFVFKSAPIQNLTNKIKQRFEGPKDVKED